MDITRLHLVISTAAVDHLHVDVRVEFGDFNLNGFLDIRGADFFSNKRTSISKSMPIGRTGYRRVIYGFLGELPKNRESWSFATSNSL